MLRRGPYGLRLKVSRSGSIEPTAHPLSSSVGTGRSTGPGASAVAAAAITLGMRWSKPLGFQWRDVWDVSMEFDIDAQDKPSPELHAAMFRMLD